MNNDFDDLTIIILTFKTDLNILEKCLSSINSTIKIFIIENSDNFIHREGILDKYENVTIYCTGENLGYSNGNNFGINKVNTNYVLILNPDTICETNYFDNIKPYIQNKLNFSIIGSQYINETSFAPAGFFKKNLSMKNTKFKSDLHLYEVDWIVGCAMLIKLDEFKNKNIFDENFFLFFEEFDLCKKLKKNNKLVYSSPKLLVNHLGFKSSTRQVNEIDLIKLRSWHFMWSYFYYHKKNDGYFNAVKLTIGKVIRSIFKMIFYTIMNNEKKKILYKYRFLGAINSMSGKNSWFRIN